MAHNDGALARQLDFGDEEVPSALRRVGNSGQGLPADQPPPKASAVRRSIAKAEALRAKAGLRLAVPSAVLRGPDKYKVLEHRRRQAQIKARRIIDADERLNFEC